MIEEIGGNDYVHGVELSLDADLVVVRGLITPEEALEPSAAAPENTGRIRAYLQPELSRVATLYPIDSCKAHVGEVLKARLGRFSTLGDIWLQKPDMIRTGCVPVHIDDRTILASTSVNFDNQGERTTFWAERVAEATAPYGEITKSYNKHFKDKGKKPFFVVNLDVGDAVIISRGVAHMSEGSAKRKSGTYRTRGLVR